MARPSCAVPAQRRPLPVDHSNKRGWGALRLTTIGRKSGKQRNVIIGYIEDGPNLVTLAMNGWDEGHPAWWLNLEAHPDAIVRLARQRPRAGARAAPPPATSATGCGSVGPRSTPGTRRLRQPAVDRDAGGRPRTPRRNRLIVRGGSEPRDRRRARARRDRGPDRRPPAFRRTTGRASSRAPADRRRHAARTATATPSGTRGRTDGSWQRSLGPGPARRTAHPGTSAHERTVEFDAGLAVHPEPGAGLEVDEQQPDSRIHRHVAERAEHAVAVVDRERECSSSTTRTKPGSPPLYEQSGDPSASVAR